MLPVLLVVISFVIGLKLERARALTTAALVALFGIALVITFTKVQDTDFLDSATGWVQLAAGFAGCLIAAAVGGEVRQRRQRTS